MLPSKQFKTNCFIGLEAEGPYRGQKSVFIPGSTDDETACNAINAAMRIWSPCERIYYGAGNDRRTNVLTLAKIIQAAENYNLQLDIECERVTRLMIEAQRRVGANIILISTSKDWIGYTSVNFSKIVTPDEYIWTDCKTGRTYSTRVDDPLFSQDEDLLV